MPPGFVVTTEAYSQVAAAAGLESELDGAARLGERARAALLATPVPARVADAVSRAYLALGETVPVAVRSSATAEDLPSASFAGQQDTYLNVVGVDAVLDAVRRCWASLWTDRAVAYRADAGIDRTRVRSSPWWCSGWSTRRSPGVLFTADPVSGRRTRTVLDARPGLGEAVVSGAVNPDHSWSRATAIVDHGWRQAVEVRPAAAARSRRRAVTGRQPADAQVASSTLGRRVEAHFGAPQDIEWAHRRRRRAVAHPVARDHHALPRATAAPAGLARAPLRQPRPRG